VLEYLPGELYTVSLKINHTGFPAGYGFQIVSLKDSDISAINNFINIPQGMHDVFLNGRQYVEQNSRLPFDSFPLMWQAPEEGTGSVTFYGAGNAVNGNGNSSGDGADTTFLRIAEAEVSALDNIGDDISALKIYPNPSFDYIYVQGDIAVDRINLFTISGQYIKSTDQTRLEVSDLRQGMYLVELIKGNEKKIEKLIKI